MHLIFSYIFNPLLKGVPSLIPTKQVWEVALRRVKSALKRSNMMKLLKPLKALNPRKVAYNSSKVWQQNNVHKKALSIRYAEEHMLQMLTIVAIYKNNTEQTHG